MSEKIFSISFDCFRDLSENGAKKLLYFLSDFLAEIETKTKTAGILEHIKLTPCSAFDELSRLDFRIVTTQGELEGFWLVSRFWERESWKIDVKLKGNPRGIRSEAKTIPAAAKVIFNCLSDKLEKEIKIKSEGLEELERIKRVLGT